MNNLISGLGSSQGVSGAQGMQGLMGLIQSIMQILQQLTQGQGQQQAQSPQQMMQQLSQALQNPQQAQQQNPQFAQQLQQLAQLLQKLQGAAQQQGAPQQAQQQIAQLLQQVQQALQQLGIQPAQQGAGATAGQNPFNNSTFTPNATNPVAGITSPAARQAITSSLLAPVNNDPTLQGQTPSQQLNTLKARCQSDLGVINSHDTNVTTSQKSAAIKDLGVAEGEMERIQMANRIQGQRIQTLN
jgi:small-conductance mechanosensitive channel